MTNKNDVAFNSLYLVIFGSLCCWKGVSCLIGWMIGYWIYMAFKKQNERLDFVKSFFYFF